MRVEKKKKSLTVPPFECAWSEEFRFKEAGRGCVAFEASAQNDVTLVFREQLGSQHYHYKIDNSRHYTVILGSHRNKRLKIEVDGRTVVDVAGIVLCSPSSFQSYWISIYDGLISIGEGKHPNRKLLFKWLDSEPNRNVQYVGLCSWDKHVRYQNISVLPSAPENSILWSQIDNIYVEGENEGADCADETKDGIEKWGLANFLESWDFSDAMFVVGTERMVVPAHKVVLGAAGDFCFGSMNGHVIQLPLVTYPVLHALLEYIYTGSTQIEECQLNSLRDLSLQFKVTPLINHCEETNDRFEKEKNFSHSGRKIEIPSRGSQVQQSGCFPFEAPLDVQKLEQFLATGEHSDISIHVDGQGLVARSHKLILSLWSAPFTKMFTNGMKESSSSIVSFTDVSSEAFFLLLQFMYSGAIKMETFEISPLLIEVLLLADQFGVIVLHCECCKRIMECLSEDTVCSVLQAVSSIPSCKLLEETCKRNFAMHFDYCTSASTEFVLLDEATFEGVLQHDDMTVTSEERVLDAILTWCMKACETYGWTSVDELLSTSTPEQLFGERLSSIDILLPFVRFPLMSLSLLQRLHKSNLNNIAAFRQLVAEAIKFSDAGLLMALTGQNERFQHRRSSYKELQYISDGDNNGVIHYAGTSFGKHHWMNPVLAQNITVTASSPASRYTDPKALVSKNYQGTCFAGPRLEHGGKCSWWMVDIGMDHQLMCNYYTVRQDGSTTFMRSWALQGSLDGESWTNLKVHENDLTICRPAQFASWPVTGPSALLPFRFFRVVLTAPATGPSNAWNLCICFIELYGHFR